jgi:hypothetical protein
MQLAWNRKWHKNLQYMRYIKSTKECMNEAQQILNRDMKDLQITGNIR